jgi:uncharacterized protein DUF3147
MEELLRFTIGGVLVSIFAVLGDIVRPKSFAGLFGAAPSIALATLGLTFWKQGADYAAIEGRSMMIGAIAMALYCMLVCQLMTRFRLPALAATLAALAAWLGVALGLALGLDRLLVG